MKKELIMALRGMSDILPNKVPVWHRFEAEWLTLMQEYAYREIRFPVVEKLALFKRSIGEMTDIVEKEMFSFEDRDGEPIALRPEGTAGCVRACLEHGLLHNQTQKLWYAGPMFRYERPQKGRYRQFHQVGVEAFGWEGIDVELEHLLLAARLWKILGIQDLIELQINTLGTLETRKKYREVLIAYFEKQLDSLDTDAKRRLYTNPMRILDTKNPAMQGLVEAAPKLWDYLTPESQRQFEDLSSCLAALKLPYRVNPKLVRGLDYYQGTVYEWVTHSLGAQGTLCAGGRYDTLVTQLGGKPCPAVGFAIGIDRLLLLVESLGTRPETAPVIYIVHQGEQALVSALAWAEMLRQHFPGLGVQVHFGGGHFEKSV